MNFRKIVEYTSDAKERRALNPTGVYYVEFKALDEICGVSADGRKVAEITHEKTFNWLMDRQRAGLFVVAVDLEMRVQAREIISAFQEPATEDAFVEYLESLGFQRNQKVLIGTALHVGVLKGLGLNEVTKPLLEAALEADHRKGVQAALRAKLNS